VPVPVFSQEARFRPPESAFMRRLRRLSLRWWWVHFRLEARGARGIKVHPSVQAVRPDSRRCLRLYRLCAEAACR